MWDYLSVEVAEDEGATHVVRLTGELDMASSISLAAYLDKLAHSTVIVDASGLTFVDAAGIGALLQAQQQITRRGDALVLRGASPRIRRVIELAGATALLEDPGPVLPGDELR